MKLFPAIVTLHLLGGTGLLALLCVPAVGLSRAARQQRATVIAPALRAGLWLGLALLVLQVVLGGWVSTNYAVLACSSFPTCQGSWWPAMDFSQALQIDLAADDEVIPAAPAVRAGRHAGHALQRLGHGPDLFFLDRSSCSGRTNNCRGRMVFFMMGAIVGPGAIPLHLLQRPGPLGQPGTVRAARKERSAKPGQYKAYQRSRRRRQIPGPIMSALSLNCCDRLRTRRACRPPRPLYAIDRGKRASSRAPAGASRPPVPAASCPGPAGSTTQ